MQNDSFIVGLSRRPWVYGWELRRAITALVESIGAKVPRNKVSITLTWEPIQTACVNGSGEMKLASVRDDAQVPRALFLRYVGFVVHEVLHLVYTDFTVRGNGQYLDQLHNAVEDVWIERRGIADQFTGNIQTILADLMDQMVGEAMDAVQDWTDPAQYPFVLAVTGRRYGAKVPVAEGLGPIFAEASRRIDDAKSSRDTLRIAQWVYDQLKGLPKDQEKKGKGKPQGDNGADSGEGDKAADGQATPGKATAPKSSTVAANPEPSLQIEDGMGGASIPDHGIAADGTYLSSNPRREVEAAVPAKLRYEVRRLFDNSGTTLFNPGRRSGSLNVRSLHKVTIDDRLFQKREDLDGIDSAVSIVLDVSGSMCDRINQACNVAYALADSLISAEAQVEIVLFGSMASRAMPFCSNKAKAKDVMSRVHMGGGTNDRMAVRMALDHLLLRQERRRVMFVITDGQGCVRDVNLMCQSAMALGITVIGVGIGCDVSASYPQSVTVHNVSHLGQVVFREIKLAA